MKTVKYIPHHNMKYSICSNMKNNLDIKKMMAYVKSLTLMRTLLKE